MKHLLGGFTLGGWVAVAVNSMAHEYMAAAVSFALTVVGLLGAIAYRVWSRP